MICMMLRLDKIKKIFLAFVVFLFFFNFCIADDFDEEINPHTNELDYVRSASWLISQGNSIYLRLDLSNELDMTGNDFKWDADSYWRRISKNEFRFYVNNTLTHTYLVAGVTDKMLLESGDAILLESGELLLLE